MRPRLDAAILERMRPSEGTLFYLAVAIAASAPAWIVKYPPMTDLPFHMATIRVIHSFHDPRFGFDQNFVLTLGRTQYVFYYIVGSILAYVLGVAKASVVLVSAYFAGSVLAMRELLRALGKDERLCFFVVPLLVNILFMYGLFPFLVAIPIMLFGLATAVRYFEAPTLARGVVLTVTCLALFYSHIFPFCLFGLGFALMFPWSRPREWLRAASPVVPALAVLILWLVGTDAGHLVLGAATNTAQDPKQPLDVAIGDAHNWLTNVFKDTSDEAVLIATGIVALLAVALTQADGRAQVKKVARAYALLPIACVLLYFNTTQGHGYIWLISQRFPILFLITGIPLLPMPRGMRGAFVAVAAFAVAVASTVNTCAHFIKFQLEEVGDFDQALDAIPGDKKVCALIYDRGSRIMNPTLTPFMHFGSYYQVEKGGVIMFTWAGYAHWPFKFREDRLPPEGESARLRWEWTPDLVTTGELYPYYDYVLTRGSGFSPAPGTYVPRWHGDRWTVWERR
jgi:hypothetical protein